MDKTAAENICSSVAQATSSMRQVFRIKADAAEILNRFWYVQDLLNRLLEIASENPRDFFSVQQRAYPSLIPDIVDVMSLAGKRKFTEIPAVSQCRESINELLVRITSLKASRPVTAAVSGRVNRFHRKGA